jgi:hypothetical protein
MVAIPNVLSTWTNRDKFACYKFKDNMLSRLNHGFLAFDCGMNVRVLRNPPGILQ